MNDEIEAQYRLADCYENGKGTEVNMNLAMEWYQNAAIQGHSEAIKLLVERYVLWGNCFLNGKNGFEINNEKAFGLFAKAAELGSATAYLCLGALYATGDFAEQSDERAFECYKKVLELDEINEGDKMAKNMANHHLAIFYDLGLGVEKNAKLAAKHRELTNYDEAGEVFFKGLMATPPNSRYAKEVLPIKTQIHIAQKEYDLLEEFVENYFEDVDDTEKNSKSVYLTIIEQAKELDKVNQKLKDENKTLKLKELENEELREGLAEKEKTLEEKNKQLQEKEKELEDMMSMFAHKFRSPLDAIIYNTTHENQVKLYTEAAQTMRGLLDIFSLISTDAALLKRKLMADNYGNGRLITTFSKALDMVLLHLLTNSNREKVRQHYIAHAKLNDKVDSNISRKVWREDYIELEQSLQTEWEQDFATLILQSASLAEKLDWIAKYFFSIQLIGFDRKGIEFEEYGITESLLMMVINEIVVNVFKYYSSETKQPVIIEWVEKDGSQVIICRNPSYGSERTIFKGSQKGHVFLSTLARNIGIHFVKPIPKDEFVVEFGIPNKLLISNK